MKRRRNRIYSNYNGKCSWCNEEKKISDITCLYCIPKQVHKICDDCWLSDCKLIKLDKSDRHIRN